MYLTLVIAWHSATYDKYCTPTAAIHIALAHAQMSLVMSPQGLVAGSMYCENKDILCSIVKKTYHFVCWLAVAWNFRGTNFFSSVSLAVTQPLVYSSLRFIHVITFPTPPRWQSGAIVPGNLPKLIAYLMPYILSTGWICEQKFFILAAKIISTQNRTKCVESCRCFSHFLRDIPPSLHLSVSEYHILPGPPSTTKKFTKQLHYVGYVCTSGLTSVSFRHSSLCDKSCGPTSSSHLSLAQAQMSSVSSSHGKRYGSIYCTNLTLAGEFGSLD